MSLVQADVATLLNNAAIATLGTDLFIGFLPAKPDSAVMVRSVAGLRSITTHSGVRYERPRIQVLVRAVDWPTAATRSAAAFLELFKHNILIGTTRYIYIEPVDSPSDTGVDANDRRLLTFNCAVMKEV